MNPDAVIPSSTPAPVSGPTIWSRAKDVWHLLVRAGDAWNQDNVMRLSAAVAMYTILSLSPLLVITIKVLSVVFRDESAAQEVGRQVEAVFGRQGGQAIEGMITDTVRAGSGLLPTLLSVGMLLFTASGVFNELRDSLNAVWGVTPKAGRGIWSVLRDRLLSVGMVFVIGFLLLVSQVISVVLTMTSEYVIGTPGWAAVVVDLVVSTLVSALLFAVLFRILPEARLGWPDVLFGAVVTAILFKSGQFLLSLYFTYGSTASTYGAAGSFVVVLLFVYYSCWILFYGAELIKERVHMLGREIEPSPDAVRVDRPTEAAWHDKK